MSGEDARTIRVVEASSAGRLSFTLSLKQKACAESMGAAYDGVKYDLSCGYTMPASFKSLVSTGIPEFVEDGEKYVERVMRALYHFKQCILIGPSGTGKTHLVRLVSQMAGLPVWEINCALQTSIDDLFGRFVAKSAQNWLDGRVVSWLRFGGILYLNEANKMSQDLATRLNAILDVEGHLLLAEKDNEIIPRHKHGYLVMSMNPYWAGFSGTKPLNPALRRKMNLSISLDYLSVAPRISQREIRFVAHKGKIPFEMAENLVRVAAEIRRLHKNEDLPHGPSLGDLVNWAVLIADGLSLLDAAEETIISLASGDPEVQASVRRIVQISLGSAGMGSLSIETD